MQNIIRYERYAFMNAQKLLFLTLNNWRGVAAEHGSVASPRVTTNCGDPVCMNHTHLIERKRLKRPVR